MVRGRANLLPQQAVLWTLAASLLTVPTPDPNYDGVLAHFQPLLVRLGDHNGLVVFTDPHRMGRFAERAPQFIQLVGRDVIVSMPPDTGLVVNPETDLGFEIGWQGLAALRDELRLPSS